MTDRPELSKPYLFFLDVRRVEQAGGMNYPQDIYNATSDPKDRSVVAVDQMAILRPQ
jgi:hypothetical protein